MRIALRNTLENSADMWTLDPEEQFKVIAGREWSGRHMGGWHIHPPIFTAEGWAAAGRPSGPDMENARTSGQLIVLSFHLIFCDVFTAEPRETLGRRGHGASFFSFVVDGINELPEPAEILSLEVQDESGQVFDLGFIGFIG